MSGHGHVTPNPNGVKARCGGPALCQVCYRELVALKGEGVASAQVRVPMPAITDTEGVPDGSWSVDRDEDTPDMVRLTMVDDGAAHVIYLEPLEGLSLAQGVMEHSRDILEGN